MQQNYFSFDRKFFAVDITSRTLKRKDATFFFEEKCQFELQGSCSIGRQRSIEIKLLELYFYTG